MAKDKVYDVIVVGGGMTGVSAVMNLQEHKDVLLLEAGDCLGGRTRSLEVDVDGFGTKAVDLGGHMFGMYHRRILKLVDELGLSESVIDYVATYGRNPSAVCRLRGKTAAYSLQECFFQLPGLDKTASWSRKFQLLLMCQRLELMCDLVDGKHPWSSLNAQDLDQISHGIYSDQTNGEPWMKDLLRSGVRCVWSQDVDEMSALYVLWYMKNNLGFSQIFSDLEPSPQQYSLRCGLGGLLQRWAKKIDQAEISLNSPVETIEVLTNHDSSDDRLVRVTIGGENKKTYVAKKVIVTATPAACKKIQFMPDLPPERQLIHDQPGGFAVKATVFYKFSWWNNNTYNGKYCLAVLNGEDYDGIDWVMDISPKAGDYHALMVFIKPNWYDQHKQKDKENLGKAIGGALAEMYGDDQRATDIINFEIRDWRSMPYSNGGPNTNFTCGVLSSIEPVFNKPDHGCLYFAGAEYATEFTGYVEGAICSGEYVAKQILEGDDAKAPGVGIQYMKAVLDLFLYCILVALVWIMDCKPNEEKQSLTKKQN